MSNLNLPSDIQIKHCGFMGFEYLGDGIFGRNDQIGWFTNDGFHKE